jgi:hypothetical protein
MIGVMALHPAGVPVHGSAAAGGPDLNLIVHAIAIATAPLLTFGFYAFTRAIGFERPAASLAFFCYAFGAVTVMLAATMSGLVAPRLIEAMREAPAGDQSLFHGLLRLEWYLNQSFATLHVALFSAAIFLWAIAWPGKSIFAGMLRLLGLAVGAGISAWLLSGTLVLNVHGMGAVVLAQSTWIILAAIGLLTLGPDSDA